MDSETDETARLEFNMGLDTGKISIANVCVKVAEATDNTNAAKEPLEDGNHIYNGTFDQGTGKLAFWNLDEAAKEAGSAVNGNRELAWKAGCVEQKGIQLLQSDKYQLTLQAVGEGKTLTVSLQDKSGNKVYADKQFTLSKDMSSYELTFVMPADVTDKEAVLHMETTGSITLDNVVMKRLTDNNVSYDDVKIYPLINGDFEDGLNGWTEYTDGGAACQTAPKVEQDGSNHYLAVNGAKGGQAYFNMLMQEGVELKKGTKYDISFKAKATSEQSIEVKIENASYTSTLAESFTVGIEWKDYSFTFKSGLEGATALKYLLAGVNVPTTVYFDDIKIKVSGVESKIAPVLSTTGSVKQGNDVMVAYAEDTAWEIAAMRVLISGEELNSSLYTIDKKENTITIKADAFAEAGIFTIKVIADGYDYTQVNQTIISSVVSEDGNVVPEFSEWEHYVGSDWAYVESKIVDQDENNIELSVKANGGWADTAWGVQLVKADIPVTVGYPYTISFKAKAGQDKKFALKAEDANGKEMLYKEYSLKAGEEQTITVELDEMTTEFVKLYFALGVFADETNIDTTVTISDFEMCNTLGDGDEEPETPEEEEKPSHSTDKKQNQSDTSDKNDSEQNTTSSTSSATVNKVVRVEDKLANVIFDSAVPLTGTPTNPMSFTQALTNLDLGMERDTTIDYGEGFSSVTYIPNKPAKLGYEVTIHMGIGAEHAGNIAYTTNEYSYMVVLYQ